MPHRLSSRAASDLEEIWIYVATESGSFEIANTLIDSIADRFHLLATYPHAGRERNDDLGQGRRTFPIGEYVIIYRIEKEQAWILRVVHGRRDLESLFAD